MNREGNWELTSISSTQATSSVSSIPGPLISSRQHPSATSLYRNRMSSPIQTMGSVPPMGSGLNAGIYNMDPVSNSPSAILQLQQHYGNPSMCGPPPAFMRPHQM